MSRLQELFEQLNNSINNSERIAVLLEIRGILSNVESNIIRNSSADVGRIIESAMGDLSAQINQLTEAIAVLPPGNNNSDGDGVNLSQETLNKVAEVLNVLNIINNSSAQAINAMNAIDAHLTNIETTLRERLTSPDTPTNEAGAITDLIPSLDAIKAAIFTAADDIVNARNNSEDDERTFNIQPIVNALDNLESTSGQTAALFRDLIRIADGLKDAISRNHTQLISNLSATTLQITQALNSISNLRDNQGDNNDSPTLSALSEIIEQLNNNISNFDISLQNLRNVLNNAIQIQSQAIASGRQTSIDIIRAVNDATAAIRESINNGAPPDSPPPDVEEDSFESELLRLARERNVTLQESYEILKAIKLNTDGGGGSGPNPPPDDSDDGGGGGGGGGGLLDDLLPPGLISGLAKLNVALFTMKVAFEAIANTISPVLAATLGAAERFEIGLISSAQNIALTSNLIASSGEDILDPLAKISLLSSQLRGVREDLQRDTANLVGATEESVTQIFDNVLRNFGRVQGQTKGSDLEAAKELTVGIQAALGSLGINDEVQRTQETRALLNGDISNPDATLGRVLQSAGLSTADLDAAIAAGTSIDLLNSKLNIFVQGNLAAAQSITNLTSNITDVFQRASRQIGQVIRPDTVRGLNVLVNAFANLESVFLDKIKPSLDVLGMTIDPLFDSLSEVFLTFDDSGSSLVDTFVKLGSALLSVTTLVLDFVALLGNAGLNNALNVILFAVNKVIDAFTIGAQTLSGFIVVLNEFYKDLGKGLMKLIKDPLDALRNLDETFSFKNTGEVFDDTVKNLNKVINAVDLFGQNSGKLEKALSKLPLAIQDAINEINSNKVKINVDIQAGFQGDVSGFVAEVARKSAEAFEDGFSEDIGKVLNRAEKDFVTRTVRDKNRVVTPEEKQAFDDARTTINTYISSLEDLTSKRQELSEKQLTLDTESAEYKKVTSELEEVNKQFTATVTDVEELNEAFKTFGFSAAEIGTILGDIGINEGAFKTLLEGLTDVQRQAIVTFSRLEKENNDLNLFGDLGFDDDLETRLSRVNQFFTTELKKLEAAVIINPDIDLTASQAKLSELRGQLELAFTTGDTGKLKSLEAQIESIVTNGLAGVEATNTLIEEQKRLIKREAEILKELQETDTSRGRRKQLNEELELIQEQKEALETSLGDFNIVTSEETISDLEQLRETIESSISAIGSGIKGEALSTAVDGIVENAVRAFEIGAIELEEAKSALEDILQAPTTTIAQQDAAIAQLKRLRDEFSLTKESIQSDAVDLANLQLLSGEISQESFNVTELVDQLGDVNSELESAKETRDLILQSQVQALENDLLTEAAAKGQIISREKIAAEALELASNTQRVLRAQRDVNVLNQTQLELQQKINNAKVAEFNETLVRADERLDIESELTATEESRRGLILSESQSRKEITESEREYLGLLADADAIQNRKIENEARLLIVQQRLTITEEDRNKKNLELVQLVKEDLELRKQTNQNLEEQSTILNAIVDDSLANTLDINADIEESIAGQLRLLDAVNKQLSDNAALEIRRAEANKKILENKQSNAAPVNTSATRELERLQELQKELRASDSKTIKVGLDTLNDDALQKRIDNVQRVAGKQQANAEEKQEKARLSAEQEIERLRFEASVREESAALTRLAIEAQIAQLREQSVQAELLRDAEEVRQKIDNRELTPAQGERQLLAISQQIGISEQIAASNKQLVNGLGDRIKETQSVLNLEAEAQGLKPQKLDVNIPKILGGFIAFDDKRIVRELQNLGNTLQENTATAITDGENVQLDVKEKAFRTPLTNEEKQLETKSNSSKSSVSSIIDKIMDKTGVIDFPELFKGSNNISTDILKDILKSQTVDISSNTNKDVLITKKVTSEMDRAKGTGNDKIAEMFAAVVDKQTSQIVSSLQSVDGSVKGIKMPDVQLNNTTISLDSQSNRINRAIGGS